MVGAGFWAQYQLAAWSEIAGAECVAVCDRNEARAKALATKAGVSRVYPDMEAMLQTERLDFLDIVTGAETHHALTLLAAQYRTPVICQKPMATSLADAEEMVRVCHEAGIPFYIHENWRWQRPLRELKAVLDSGALGMPFRAHFAFRTGYPVLENQPYLAEAEEYILSDMGTHILDTARFFFGEAQSLYCQFHRIHPHIKGEDAATVMLKMNGVTVVCDMAEAETPLEHDKGDTLAFFEGDKGSAELTSDCWLRVTTQAGTHARRVPPKGYAWAHPDYMLYQSAMASCLANLFAGLTGGGVAETNAEDNIRTMRLVYAAYQSGRVGEALHFS
jgi:predicted dehydrogenase